MPENSNPTAKKKPRGKPFPKGVTGNPNGRPPHGPEHWDIVAHCKMKSMRALEVIESIMEGGENERNKLAAAQSLIERGYGKPVQPTDVQMTGEVTINEIRRTIVR